MTTYRRGVFKKPSRFVPREAHMVLDRLSKQALMDVAWNLACLGTDESEEQVFQHIAAEVRVVCEARGDTIPKGLPTGGDHDIQKEEER
jgi:hypothetical protein